MKLVCALAGVPGSPFSVNIKDNDLVDELKKSIKKEKPNKIKCDADELKLYLAKKNGKWLRYNEAAVKQLKTGKCTKGVLTMMRAEDELEETLTLQQHLEINKMPAPTSGEIHVLVALPVQEQSISDTEINRALTILKMRDAFSILTLKSFHDHPVSEEEFQLDALDLKQKNEPPLMLTPSLNKFWEEYGGFPSCYYIRREEVMFWKVLKKTIFAGTNRRTVIVGSPGVGKSCFLMLVGFYMAFIHKKKVLIIRNIKTKTQDNSVVYLDGQGSFARELNVPPECIFDLRKDEKLKGAFVFVDGYTQAALESRSELRPFHILATSCQYDKKQDDSAVILALPAWRIDDLLQYARLSDWLIQTELQTTTLSDSVWHKLVKEQYFYSGGSLREFCRTRHELIVEVQQTCGYVSNDQSFVLMCSFGGERSKTQVDRIRRHYIADCNDEDHYVNSSFWCTSVDSGYALKLLGKQFSADKQFELYMYAKSVGASFSGIAYELYFHHAVHQSSTTNTTIFLKLKERSYYEKIEIHVSNFQCDGKTDKECYDLLTRLCQKTYWHPDYPTLPFIDAVVMCEGFKKNGSSETVLAYIQVTIQQSKTFEEDNLRDLNKVLDKNPNFVNIKRVFVVVVPDASMCAAFKLQDAPDQKEVLTMVGSFKVDKSVLGKRPRNS